MSCPDITLLPALARLLDTDPNTLLSFQQELSVPEIAAFMTDLCRVVDEEGIDRAIDLAREKLHEFPACDKLLINVALTLEGMISFSPPTAQTPAHQALIDSLYDRAAASEDTPIANEAKAMLIAKYIDRREFEAAEAMLQTLPTEQNRAADRTRLQVKLWMAQEKWADAARVTERSLLNASGDVQSALFTLLEIALREGHFSDADSIAETSRQFVGLFDLWGYGTYVADFQYALIQKDAAKGLAALQHMLPALQHAWKVNHSPLYRHQPPNADGIDLGKRILPRILRDFADPANEEYAFLRSDPACAAWLAAFEADLPDYKSERN